MIEFVICDDDRNFLSRVETLINIVMLKKKVEYKISKFYDYNEKFTKSLGTHDTIRIYILEIVSPSKFGMYVGRLILTTLTDLHLLFISDCERSAH